MSLLEIPDFNVEKGASRMLLAQSPFSPWIILEILLVDLPAHVEELQAVRDAGQASCARAIGVRAHSIRIPAQNFYR